MSKQSSIGLIGLAVMGQNLALNVASKGFSISVWNRTYEKTEHTVERAKSEGLGDKLVGFKEMKEFVDSLESPRAIIILVQAGKPVDAVIESITPLLAPNDLLIDGGNEWYTNTVRRGEALKSKKILYMGMGVSGGEEGARHGPSLMPGGPREAYDRVQPIISKVAAQVDGPCVTYIGEGGSGVYHNLYYIHLTGIIIIFVCVIFVYVCVF
jgi:6-phosphogluconate dehydrogenase